MQVVAIRLYQNARPEILELQLRWLPHKDQSVIAYMEKLVWQLLKLIALDLAGTRWLLDKKISEEYKGSSSASLGQRE